MVNLTSFLLNTQAKRKTVLWLIIIVVLASVFLVVVNFLFSSETSFSRLLNWVDPGKYQAVFLSNGQVYFGKVTDVNRDTLVLENIYYLRIAQALQAGSEDEEQIIGDNFSLIKLGNEIHGPQDRMSINLNHVLFVEDLGDDSKIVEAIEEYKDRD